MAWTVTTSPADLLAAAGDFLRSQPVENTALLTVADTLMVRGSHAYGDTTPLLGWWRDPDGAVGGAFLQTPPHPLQLARSRGAAVTDLAAVLAARAYPLAGLNAEPADADLFAAEWRRLTGRTARPGRGSRLYRLADLVPPHPAVPGVARVAGSDDRDLLIAWFEDFHRELGEPDPTIADRVDDRIGYGGLTLWEVDGAHVSMAGHTRRVADMARVAPVYTPPHLRGRGYAAAVTAAVSRALLDAGTGEVLLFTDLANRTANLLYQRLGYQAVSDRVELSFVDRSAGSRSDGTPPFAAEDGDAVPADR
jgi:GNAT superfamily N-acetyltransferase